MRCNKVLMLATGILATVLSSNAYAVNCGISYYCYRSMTPGPAPEGSAALARRTLAAANRVARVNSNNRRAQPVRAATPARAAPRTLQQRQAEARRREQEQQRQLAERRRQVQQQEQQRLAQVRRQQQQRAAAAANRNRTQPTNARDRLIAQQRAAYLAQQRNNQRPATATPARPATPAQRPAPVRPSVLTASPGNQQTCQVIKKKVTELNRQAVLRSKEKKYDQAQRLFKAVEQLKREAKNNKCPGAA